MKSKKSKKKISRIPAAMLLLGACGVIIYFAAFKNQPLVESPVTRSEEIPKVATTSSVEIVRGATDKKQVIFTFDGGSIDVSGNRILDVLAKHNVKGTFFLTGPFVEKNPELVRRMVAQGHEIFNHTYTHPHLPTLTKEQILEEFARMERALVSTTGVSSKPYFRAPFGERSKAVLETAAEAGYQSVFWTRDALDWKPGLTNEKVKGLILSHVSPGEIYLMHIGDSITGDILDEVFTEIKKRGYTPVSLTQGI